MAYLDASGTAGAPGLLKPQPQPRIQLHEDVAGEPGKVHHVGDFGPALGQPFIRTAQLRTVVLLDERVDPTRGAPA